MTVFAGIYMGLRLGVEHRGNVYALTSPMYSATGPSKLSFDLYMDGSNTFSTMSVNCITELDTLKSTLATVAGPLDNNWVHIDVCLPDGVYYIQFMATYDVLDDGMIGLDSITLSGGCNGSATGLSQGMDICFTIMSARKRITSHCLVDVMDLQQVLVKVWIYALELSQHVNA